MKTGVDDYSKTMSEAGERLKFSYDIFGCVSSTVKILNVIKIEMNIILMTRVPNMKPEMMWKILKYSKNMSIS